MNLKVKNKTLFLCLPALLNMPFFGLSAFGANTEKGNDKGNGPKRPNILVLLTDDQTFSTIHAWGNGTIQTPNMDRLVSRGISFTQTHVMGGFNGAISQPSRAMLLTGRGLMDIHRNGGVIPENERTFRNYSVRMATRLLQLVNGTVTMPRLPVRFLQVQTFFSVECILTGNTMNWDIGALTCISTIRQGSTIIPTVNGWMRHSIPFRPNYMPMLLSDFLKLRRRTTLLF